VSSEAVTSKAVASEALTSEVATSDFTGLVLRWGAPQLRDLPWRRTRDPWAVLVSEVMLQQTQVVRVIERWERFLDQFPTYQACADAALGDVLRQWTGLGYPRRARNLHLAATEINRLGAFPSDLQSLLALPGIGPYTARAVMAFAFELDVAVVDTNIARVYARQLGRTLTAREVQAAADASVPLGDGWLWNQCLMDLGATICRPAPKCDECPAVQTCRWRGSACEDPAIGSAGVSAKQARFQGSDREARGRLMKSLAAGRVANSDVASVMGRPDDVARRLVAALIAEGLCEPVGDHVELPMVSAARTASKASSA
jgi:A/G-specific adenine glycosylase